MSISLQLHKHAARLLSNNPNQPVITLKVAYIRLWVVALVYLVSFFSSFFRMGQPNRYMLWLYDSLLTIAPQYKNSILFLSLGNVLLERDPEYNPDLFEGDKMSVLPGSDVISNRNYRIWIVERHTTYVSWHELGWQWMSSIQAYLF